MIIMNLMMPKLDGYEAARLIRRDPSLISSQMIAYSTYYDRSLTDAAAEADFDEYVQKPVAMRQLKDLVSRRLKRR